MTTSTIIQSLYQIGAIQFGEFKLKSGKTSSIYINLRKIISYPTLMQEIADAMWEKTQSCPMELICGVPYTALPIATCISIKHQIPMVMRRKEKKDYGTKQMIEGVFTKGQRCLIVEDVITTGSSIIETVQDLENEGIVVNDVVVLIDREQGGRENLEKKFNVHSLITLSEILKTLIKSAIITKNECDIIEKFLVENTTK